MKSGGKKIWIVILVVAVAAAIACIIYFAVLLSGSKMSDDEKNGYTKATQSAEQTEKPTEIPESGIDFDKLLLESKNVVGWLRVDGTDIDYPVMRTAGVDDDYYLDHSYKGEYNTAGAIYMEKKNNGSFADSVTVLYGHNWRYNGYFRPLYSFKDSEFFKENRYMYIYTPEKSLKYEIYAAYEYDDRHILNSFDFADKSVLLSYLQSTLDPSSLNRNVRTGITLDESSKILTLSTCVEGVSTSRYLVQGVLVAEE